MIISSCSLHYHYFFSHHFSSGGKSGGKSLRQKRDNVFPANMNASAVGRFVVGDAKHLLYECIKLRFSLLYGFDNGCFSISLSEYCHLGIL